MLWARAPPAAPKTTEIIENDSPPSILPVELWESIVHWVFPDEELLKVGRVCKTFSVICMRVYLGRTNTSTEYFLTTELALSSRILDGLSLCLPFHSLPAQSIVCNLRGSQLQQLRSISDVIQRADNLNTVTFNFEKDVFKLRPQARASILDAFRCLISEVAWRVPGPIFIVSQGQIFSCRSSDISHWNLTSFEYNHPARARRQLLARIRHRPTPREDHGPWSTKIRLHTGNTRQVQTLRNLRHATLKLVAASGSAILPAFSVLTFNDASITYFVLDHCMEKPLFPCLSMVLEKITLPALKRLYIYTHAVDSAVLRAFLVRHPWLEQIEFNNYNATGPVRPLVDPPLAHPGLITLRTLAYGNVPTYRLVQGLISSPNLQECTFRFPAFVRATDPRGQGPLIDLRCIAGREAAADIKLSLCLNEPRRPIWDLRPQPRPVTAADAESALWANTSEGCNIARSLNSVRAVDITVWSLEVARAMLPWLALLPALQAVSFKLYIKYNSRAIKQKRLTDDELTSAATKFLREARVVIPHVTDVACIAR